MRGQLHHELVGESEAIQDVLEITAKAASAGSSVLIQGESGTGKELVAHAVHRNSSYAQGPFIAVNCGALPESLVESELFGHEKGSFTGAIAQKIGKLEAASHGTLFLDEIGELPLPIQAKLLRALQQHAIERVGSTRTIPLDFRVIAATNRDLATEVSEGRFREDLYYRVRVLLLAVPPLRDRSGDILILARHFLTKFEKNVQGLRHLSPEAETSLQNYDWPGNIRQLQNVIEEASVMCSSDVIQKRDIDRILLSNPRKKSPRSLNYYKAKEETKRWIVETAIKRGARTYKRLAEILGLHPNCVHRFVKQLGMTHLME